MTDTTLTTTGSGRPLSLDAQTRELRNRAQVRAWLYVMLLMLVALVIVGGATRLTDSGLSITEWKPIHGVIPLIGEAQWQEELAK